MVRVAVATSNQEKIGAVKRAFHTHFEAECQVIGISCDSTIEHGQPWGMQHTFEGASARLSSLRIKSEGGGFQFIASVENGVFPILTHDETFGQDVACVIVECLASKKREFTFSSSRPFPLAAVQSLRKSGSSGAEIGQHVRDWYLSNPWKTSREQQIFEATCNVLSGF